MTQGVLKTGIIFFLELPQTKLSWKVLRTCYTNKKPYWLMCHFTIWTKIERTSDKKARLKIYFEDILGYIVKMA